MILTSGKAKKWSPDAQGQDPDISILTGEASSWKLCFVGA